MVSYYENWVKNYPIISIEDGLDENDWEELLPLVDKNVRLDKNKKEIFSNWLWPWNNK